MQSPNEKMLKSKVVKSKSSNSAITTKTDGQRNKKSRSNAEFQTMVMKKRGVYVEKKSSNASIVNTDADQNKKERVKAPRRPRAGQKHFLTSVLSILSKSTTGTQYPENGTETPWDAKKTDTQDVAKRLNSRHSTPRDDKKKKYKSKVLNDNKNQTDKFEVLKHRSEFSATSSLYSNISNNDNVKWSDLLPRLVPEPDENNTDVYKKPVTTLVKEVTEGRKVKKLRLDDDPSTLIVKNTDSKGLYNFFVDLLETTFSVYNVNAELKTALEDMPRLPSAVPSHAAMEIDEAVVKKLQFDPDIFNDISQKPSKTCYTIKTDSQEWKTRQIPDYFKTQRPVKKLKRQLSPTAYSKRRIRSESFAFVKPTKMSSPTTQSTHSTKHKSSQKRNKITIINLLKKQLRDCDTYEEPQNLYQALKVMARTKRKSQKSIHFEHAKTGDDGECMFKRREVISSSTKSSTKYANSNTFKSSDFYSNRRYPIRYPSWNVSNYSLQVYGYDNDFLTNQYQKKEKEMLAQYHYSPLPSQNNIIKNPYEKSSTTISDDSDVTPIYQR